MKFNKFITISIVLFYVLFLNYCKEAKVSLSDNYPIINHKRVFTDVNSSNLGHDLKPTCTDSKWSKNKYFKFICGVVVEVSGNPYESGKIINKCLTPAYLHQSSTDLKDSENVFETYNNVLKKMDKYLVNDLQPACKNKKKVREFANEKCLRVRFKRLFVEKNKTQATPMDYLVKTMCKDKMYEKTKNTFDTKLSRETTNILRCLANKIKTIGFANKINRYIDNKSVYVRTKKDFINTQVELFCNWSDYQDTIGTLNNGFKAIEVGVEHEFISMFLGKMIKMLARIKI